jgi:hypothetical protein
VAESRLRYEIVRNSWDEGQRTFEAWIEMLAAIVARRARTQPSAHAAERERMR